MSEKPQTFHLRPLPHPSRRNCWEAVKGSPDGYIVTVRKPTRTERQNALIQPLIREWAEKHDPILVNGEPTKLGLDDWRHILVATFRRETQRLALFDGALILLAASSKELTVNECTDFVDYLHAEAGRRGFYLSRIEQERVA